MIKILFIEYCSIIPLQAIHGGPESMQSMYPDVFHQLLTFIEYGVRVPKYGHLDTKAFGSVKGPQVENSSQQILLANI